jgi:hypothetical protein
MIEKRINYRFGGGYQGGAPGNTGQSRGGGGNNDRGGGGSSARERGISQQYSGPRGTTGTIDRGGPDRSPYEMIGGQKVSIGDVLGRQQALERANFLGPTVFGPGRKYTGSFLDRIFGGGYRPVTPTGQFQSRFSQMGGLGKGILGGIIGLINPLAGLAYRGITSLPSIRNYDTLADYARGEFGLFQNEDENEVDTIDIRDKYNRMGIMNPNLIIPQPKPGINLNDYVGLENVFNNATGEEERYYDPYQGGMYP